MELIYDVRPTKVFIEELENTVRYIQYNLQNEIAAKNFAKKVYKALDSLSYFPNIYRNWIFEDGSESKYKYILIGKHIAFYVVFEEENLVEVVHLMYGRSNINYRLKEFEFMENDELNDALKIDI